MAIALSPLGTHPIGLGGSQAYIQKIQNLRVLEIGPKHAYIAVEWDSDPLADFYHLQRAEGVVPESGHPHWPQVTDQDFQTLADDLLTTQYTDNDVVTGQSYVYRVKGGMLSYADEVLADNPVAYWRLSETSGSTVADETGNGHDGTVYGADLNVSGPGTLGSAASFDGTDDWIGFSAPPLTSDTSSATFEAWVNIPVDGPTCTIFSQADNSDSEHWIQFVAHSGSDHKLRLIGRYSTNYNPAVANTPLDDGLWHHVVAVVDDYEWHDITFYVDGVDDGASEPDTDRPSIDTHDAAAIGALRRNNDDLADLMEGLVNEVAIYDYALSAARIQAHYDAAGVT